MLPAQATLLVVLLGVLLGSSKGQGGKIINNDDWAPE